MADLVGRDVLYFRSTSARHAHYMVVAVSLLKSCLKDSARCRPFAPGYIRPKQIEPAGAVHVGLLRMCVFHCALSVNSVRAGCFDLMAAEVQ